MRVPRRHVGTALLVAAMLLAALAASLRFFVASSAPSAGAGAAGLTPVVGGGTTGGPPNGLSGQPAPGTGGRSRASAAVVVPSAVTVAGAAALPSAHVHPGYGSPEDAVDGFYLALLGGTPTLACAYATSPCPSFGTRRITGRVTVLDAVSHDGEALVQVTGTICVSGSCVPLTDRVVMPAGPASFAASWTSLTGGVYGWAGSPLPCVQDQATRQWRVKLR